MFGFNRQFARRGMCVLAVALPCMVMAAPPADKPSLLVQAQLGMLSQQDREMVLSWSPELRDKFFTLSPEVRATLGKLHAGHTRHSKTLTLRQVMQEILSEYQAVVAAIATDNVEQAADSARRLANHRIPVGGLLPYFPLDKINDESLAALPAMNDVVEGAALRLADEAERGRMAVAAVRVGEIAGGCVACHQLFRGRPGISPQLRPEAKKTP